MMSLFFQNEEPFFELIPQGIVRGRTFLDGQTGKYLKSSEVIKNGEIFWQFSAFYKQQYICIFL